MLGHKICESFLYRTLPKFMRLTFLWAAGRIIFFTEWAACLMTIEEGTSVKKNFRLG